MKNIPTGEALTDWLATKQAVAHAMEGGVRFWQTCTGCHESNDGHPTGPYSNVLQCHVGFGCSECGGIGAIWQDYGTEEEFQRICGNEEPPEDFGGVSPSEPHLIRRHGAFFRPNASGYCTDIAGAGIYSGDEARSYLHVEGLTIHPVEAYETEIKLVLEGADRLRAALLATPADGGGHG